MKIGSHCIMGEDYKEECERKKCTMKELCRKEHQKIEKEEEFRK